MNIDLTNNELNTLRRLGNALSSDMIPVAELRGFISGLQRKIENPVGKPAKRSRLKVSRKEEYRKKLRIA